MSKNIYEYLMLYLYKNIVVEFLYEDDNFKYLRTSDHPVFRVRKKSKLTLLENDYTIENSNVQFSNLNHILDQVFKRYRPLEYYFAYNELIFVKEYINLSICMNFSYFCRSTEYRDRKINEINLKMEEMNFLWT